MLRFRLIALACILGLGLDSSSFAQSFCLNPIVCATLDPFAGQYDDCPDLTNSMCAMGACTVRAGGGCVQGGMDYEIDIQSFVGTAFTPWSSTSTNNLAPNPWQSIVCSIAQLCECNLTPSGGRICEKGDPTVIHYLTVYNPEPGVLCHP